MENEILATLNQIQTQLESISDKRSWVETWAPSISALVGVCIATVLGYLLGYRSQIKLADRKQKHQSYGELMGGKGHLLQLYVSRFEAIIYASFYEKRVYLKGETKDSLDFTEARRWMLSSEELTLEISKYQEKLFSTLGVINAVFDSSAELTNLVDNVYNFKKPVIDKIPDNIDITGIELWKTNAVTQLKDIVNQEISDPIQKLLDHLHKNI